MLTTTTAARTWSRRYHRRSPRHPGSESCARGSRTGICYRVADWWQEEVRWWWSTRRSPWKINTPHHGDVLISGMYEKVAVVSVFQDTKCSAGKGLNCFPNGDRSGEYLANVHFVILVMSSRYFSMYGFQQWSSGTNCEHNTCHRSCEACGVFYERTLSAASKSPRSRQELID